MLGNIDVTENVVAASKQLIVSLDHQKHVKSAIRTPDILNRKSYVDLDLIPPNMMVVQQHSLPDSRDVSSKCVCGHDGWKIEFDGKSNGSDVKMNYGMFFSKFLDNFFSAHKTIIGSQPFELSKHGVRFNDEKFTTVYYDDFQISPC